MGSMDHIDREPTLGQTATDEDTDLGTDTERAGIGAERPETTRSGETGAASLVDPDEAESLRSRWESIQSSFIDEPRQSVAEADRLVEDLTDRIVEGFQNERSNLEDAWERGEEVSTEDLRLTFQRYRTFFERLLRI